MNERERIIDTVRKCLALGDRKRNPNEYEAESAIRRAKSLMDIYNLSMADVAEGPKAETMGESSTAPWSAMPQWAKDLCHVSDALFSTYHFQREVGYPAKMQIVFCGAEVDTAIAVEVYKLLKLEMWALAGSWERKQRAENPMCEVPSKNWRGDFNEVPFNELTPGQRRTRKFKYMEGVVYTLRFRASEMSDQISKANAAKVTTLVIRKSDDAKRWAEAKYDLHPVIRRESNLHSDATTEGIKDGKKVSLNFKNNVKTPKAAAPLQLPSGK